MRVASALGEGTITQVLTHPIHKPIEIFRLKADDDATAVRVSLSSIARLKGGVCLSFAPLVPPLFRPSPKLALRALLSCCHHAFVSSQRSCVVRPCFGRLNAARRYT